MDIPSSFPAMIDHAKEETLKKEGCVMRYPDIHSEKYKPLSEYVELSLSLLEIKDTGMKELTCLQMVQMLPQVLPLNKQFRDEWICARKESDEYLAEYHPDSYYSEHAPKFINVVPFKTLAIIYEKAGDLKNAMWICDYALTLGLNKDGTKGGMEERLLKLKKKAGL